MKFKFLTLALASAFALSSAVVDAEARIIINRDGDDGTTFGDADTDGDGRLSREEYLAQRDEWRDDDDDSSFDEMDADGDDYVTEEELEDFVEEKVEMAMRQVDKAMENLKFSFDLDLDDHDYDHDHDYAWSSEDWNDEDWDEEDWNEDHWEASIHIDDHDFERLGETMERFGERMGHIGERLGRAVGRSVGRAMRHGDHYAVIAPRGMRMDSRDLEERIEERKAEVFKDMDENDDGELSKDEYEGSNKRFDKLDENGDGVLSLDELRVRMVVRRVMAPQVHSRQEIIVREFSDEDEDDNNN